MTVERGQFLALAIARLYVKINRMTLSLFSKNQIKSQLQLQLQLQLHYHLLTKINMKEL